MGTAAQVRSISIYRIKLIPDCYIPKAPIRDKFKMYV